MESVCGLCLEKVLGACLIPKMLHTKKDQNESITKNKNCSERCCECKMRGCYDYLETAGSDTWYLMWQFTEVWVEMLGMEAVPWGVLRSERGRLHWCLWVSVSDQDPWWRLEVACFSLWGIVSKPQVPGQLACLQCNMKICQNKDVTVWEDANLREQMSPHLCERCTVWELLKAH